MVVDSSVWLEILRSGPLHSKCAAAINNRSLHVPTLVIHEVYKKLKDKVSEDVALEAVAALSQHEVLELTREVAIRAADLSLEYKIGIADSLVLAHAECLGVELLTLDNDFAGIRGVTVLRR